MALSVKFSIKLRSDELGCVVVGIMKKKHKQMLPGIFCLFVYVKARSSSSGSSRPLNNYLLPFT